MSIRPTPILDRAQLLAVGHGPLAHEASPAERSRQRRVWLEIGDVLRPAIESGHLRTVDVVDRLAHAVGDADGGLTRAEVRAWVYRRLAWLGLMGVTP